MNWWMCGVHESKDISDRHIMFSLKSCLFENVQCC